MATSDEGVSSSPEEVVARHKFSKNFTPEESAALTKEIFGNTNPKPLVTALVAYTHGAQYEALGGRKVPKLYEDLEWYTMTTQQKNTVLAVWRTLAAPTQNFMKTYYLVPSAPTSGFRQGLSGPTGVADGDGAASAEELDSESVEEAGVGTAENESKYDIATTEAAEEVDLDCAALKFHEAQKQYELAALAARTKQLEAELELEHQQKVASVRAQQSAARDAVLSQSRGVDTGSISSLVANLNALGQTPPREHAPLQEPDSILEMDFGDSPPDSATCEAIASLPSLLKYLSAYTAEHSEGSADMVVAFRKIYHRANVIPELDHYQKLLPKLQMNQFRVVTMVPEELLMKLDTMLTFLYKHEATSPYLARLLAILLDCHNTRLPLVNPGFRYSSFWSRVSNVNQSFSATEIYLADLLFRWLLPLELKDTYRPLARITAGAAQKGDLGGTTVETSCNGFSQEVFCICARLLLCFALCTICYLAAVLCVVYLDCR